MTGLRVVTVVGARPQFVKAAALSRAFAAAGIEEILVHTGQHYDPELSADLWAGLDLPDPRYNLGVGPGSRARQLAAMLERLEPVLAETAPDVVVVPGDTTSALAGALAAATLDLPVAHLEAGLRSGRRDMAEEVNRVVVDRLATQLFCPSTTAVDNLAREGITDGVALVGDVMLDVLRQALATPPLTGQPLTGPPLTGPPRTDRPPPGSYALATVHRAENTDDRARLHAILSALARLAADGLAVVLPLHPRTAAAMDPWTPPAGLSVIRPVGYRAMLDLTAGARVVLTDSGGLQKEAYWLGIPCVTLRDETEWVETVAAGWNVCAGADPDRVVAAALHPAPTGPRPPVYGDGTAAAAVARELLKAAGR